MCVRSMWHADMLCVYEECVQVHGVGHAGLFHSALGMMVKGRMGLLASSSRAVMKHSVAAAVFP